MNNEVKKDLTERIIDFKTIRAEWNAYELEDNSIIKTKFVLIFIVIDPSERLGNGRTKALFASKNVTGVVSPQNIRGEPDKNYPIYELEKHIIKRNMKFRQIQEGGWNEYETKKFKLRIRNRVRSIDKTSKYDSRGMPSYIVRFETELFQEILNAEETPE